MGASTLDGSVSPLAGKLRSSFSYRVSFPTLPTLTAQPQSVRVLQKPYAHDLLKLNFETVSATYFSLLKTGVPVRVDWNQGKDYTSWFGYVSLVSKRVSSQASQPMVLTLVGSTFPFKERGNRVFTNVTATEAARAVVEELGFRFIGDPSDRTFPQLTMAGHSYWEWLVELAKRAGFGIWVDGTDFYFRDLTALINQGVSSAPILALGAQHSSPFAQVLSPTLDTFEVTLGDLIESAFEQRSTKNAGGVDPHSMQAHFTSSSPADLGYDLRAGTSAPLFQEFSGDVSDSLQSAAAASRARAALARFTIPAKATAQGNPRAHPFGSVYLRNTGDDTDGYWVVQEVEHVIRQQGGDYTMSMSLATDGIGGSAPSPFRSAVPSEVGSVNIPAALRTATASGIQNADPILSALTPRTGAANQGYLRTPMRWVSPRRS